MIAYSEGKNMHNIMIKPWQLAFCGLVVWSALAVSGVQGEPTSPFILSQPGSYIIRDPVPPAPFVFELNNGTKSATIDFGGDQVKYSGDLPVDESARIFFETIMQRMKKCP
jgi:hypothetical protein